MDIELDTKDVDKFIETVKTIAPTFGGINLEDIKAPEAFEIERRLKEELNIPVMHDDQHGTAIISAAALLNALEIAGKNIEDVSIVISGAGAAAVSCTRLYTAFGAKAENIVMLDSKGVIRKDRENLSREKQEFATHRKIDTLGASHGKRRCVYRPLHSQYRIRGDVKIHGKKPYCICHGKSGSRNSIRSGPLLQEKMLLWLQDVPTIPIR